MLTKTEYLRGRQCLKSLWLLKHHPEAASEPHPMQLSIMAQGKLVGEWARKCFPSGILISASDLESAAKETASLSSATTFEAVAVWENMGARADIFRKDTGEIIEVKSSGEIKEEHLYDLAMQYYIFQKAGYPIHKASIMHINKQYVRQGEVNPFQLFLLLDVTDLIEDLQKEISLLLAEQKKVIEGKMPEVLVGSHCSSPHECPFKKHCWKDIIADSIFHIKPALDSDLLKQLTERKVIRAVDIPSDIKLAPRQQIYIQQLQRTQVEINRKMLHRFLEAIFEPISYLDFETIGTAVPLYDRCRPYQKIPFQYSLHIQEGNNLLHKEYLCKEYKDPREELLLQLLHDIPSSGSIIAYNAAFEISVIETLAKEFPHYEKELLALVPRFVDLLKPFKAGMYIHPSFKGSCSLKIVLPTLVPEMNYNLLDVGDGSEAEMAYLDLILHKNEKRAEQLFAYCGLDTLALVKVLDVLKKVCL